MLLRFINAIGHAGIKACSLLGDFALFSGYAFKMLLTSRLRLHHVVVQMEKIGVHSFTIIFLTGSFTGLALALQSYIGFKRFGAEDLIGLVVTLGMTRELGPVLTGLMVMGRAGSAMTAEIGTMKITEQIDALQTLCINPIKYLVVPRLLASTFILPFLTIFTMMCGVTSSYLFGIHVLGLNPENYMSIIQGQVEITDVIGGLIKATFFGMIIALVGSYNGFITEGGARGVGNATTRTVVTGSIMILIANYLLSSIMFQTGIA